MRRTDAALEWLNHRYLYGTESERARRSITHGVVPAPPTRAVCSTHPAAAVALAAAALGYTSIQ